MDAWSHDVPAASIERGLEVVAAFGLDRIYGAGPLPVSRASEMLGHPAEGLLAEEVGFEPTVA